MRIGFLGPAPTFAESAARALETGAMLEPFEGVAALFDALVSRRVDAIVTPFENSVTGRVADTMAGLRALARPAVVLGERVEAVRFSLYRCVADRTPLRQVLGHPTALAQCRRWVSRHHAEPVAVASNGTGFARVAAGGEQGCGALAPPERATGAMIEVAQNCQGAQPNQTRFILLGADAPPTAMRVLVDTSTQGAVELAFPAPVALDKLPGRPLLLWAGRAPAGSRIGWPSATAHFWRVT